MKGERCCLSLVIVVIIIERIIHLAVSIGARSWIRQRGIVMDGHGAR
jgi:isoprenylcysteine carboxyl methyltransferase (ICMT) family protein YpbQ